MADIRATSTAGGSKTPAKKVSTKASGKKPPATVARKTVTKAKKPNPPQTEVAPSLTVTPEERWRMVAEAAYLRAEKRGFSGGRKDSDQKINQTPSGAQYYPSCSGTHCIRCTPATSLPNILRDLAPPDTLPPPIHNSRTGQYLHHFGIAPFPFNIIRRIRFLAGAVFCCYKSAGTRSNRYNALNEDSRKTRFRHDHARDSNIIKQ